MSVNAAFEDDSDKNKTDEQKLGFSDGAGGAAASADESTLLAGGVDTYFSDEKILIPEARRVSDRLLRLKLLLRSVY